MEQYRRSKVTVKIHRVQLQLLDRRHAAESSRVLTQTPSRLAVDSPRGMLPWVLLGKEKTSF